MKKLAPLTLQALFAVLLLAFTGAETGWAGTLTLNDPYFADPVSISPWVFSSSSGGNTTVVAGSSYAVLGSSGYPYQSGYVSGQLSDIPHYNGNLAFVNCGNGYTISQTLPATLQPNTTYTVSGWGGDPNPSSSGGYSSSGGEVRLNLVNGGTTTILADTGGGTPVTVTGSGLEAPLNYLASWSFTYTTGATVAAGSLQIVLFSYGGGGSAINYDDISVSSTGTAGPLAQFAISPISSPQAACTGIPIATITAQDQYGNTVTSFNGTVIFGGTAGAIGISAPFTAGVLSGASVIPTVVGSGLTVTVADSANSAIQGSTTITTVSNVIYNPYFQLPVTSSYTQYGQGGYTATNGPNGAIGGWSLGGSAAGTSAVYGVSIYNGAGGGLTAPSTTPPPGYPTSGNYQFGYLENKPGSPSTATATQVLTNGTQPLQITANTTYNLSMYVGTTGSYPVGTNFTFGLYALNGSAATLLGTGVNGPGTFTPVTTSSTAWTRASYSYTSPSSLGSLAGDTLEVIITSVLTAANDGNYNQLSFDEPTLTAVASAPFNNGWNYRQQITINDSMVAGTDQTNFPVLIKMASNAGLEANTLSSGYDITFTASDGVTVLPYEREVYSNTTGALVAWVKVPILSHEANTVLYMYYGYGNPTVADQQQTNSVWINNYSSVWHLSQTSGTTFGDSTGFANTANAQGSPTLNGGGQIGPGVALSGSSAWISTTTEYNDPQYFTASVWFKTTTPPGQSLGVPIVGFENAETTDQQGDADRHIYMGVNGDVYDGIYLGSNPGETVGGSSTYDDGNWHYAVETVSPTTPDATLALYIDGALAGTATSGNNGGVPVSFAGWWRIGSYYLSSITWTEANGSQEGFFPGNVDETHIASLARSANWIATEYNNQKSSSALTDGGQETTFPEAIVTLPGQTFVPGTGNTGPVSSTLTAGTQFSVTVTAMNSDNTIDTSITGSQTVIFTGPANAPNGTAPTYPATVTFSGGQGTALITLVDGQTTAITANSSTLAGVPSSSLTLNASALTQFVIAPSPVTTTETAGVAFTLTSITAEDTYGNVCSSGPNDFTGTVTYGGTAGVAGTSPSFSAGVLTSPSVAATAHGSGLTITATLTSGSIAASVTVNTINAASTTFISTAGGAWEMPSTWGLAGTPTPGVNYPAAGDTVIIEGGANVNVNSNSDACTSVQLGSTTGTAGTGTLTFNSGSQLTVSAGVTIGASATDTGSIIMSNGGTLIATNGFTVTDGGTWTPGTGTIQSVNIPATFFTSFNNLIITGGTATLGAALVVNGNLTINSSGAIDASTTGSGYNVTVGGNWVNNSTVSLTGGSVGFQARSALVTFNGTVAQNITGPAASANFYSVTIANTNFPVTVSSSFTTGNASAGLTVNSGAVLSPISTAVITLGGTSGGGVKGSGTIIVTHTGTSAGDFGAQYVEFSGNGTSLGSLTVEFSGTTAQFVDSVYTYSPNPLITYGGLMINNASGASLAGAITVGNALTINSGATLNTTSAHSYQVTLDGNFVNSGTFTANASPIIISGAATQSIAGFTTTGTVSMTKTGGTATLTGNMNAAALTIAGTGGTPGTLDLGTGLTHTITGTVTMTLGTLYGDSSTLNIGGSISGTGATFTPGTGTVNYNAAGAQTVGAWTYNNLILSGSGAKSMVIGTSVNGNISIAPTGPATASVGTGVNLSVGSLSLGGVKQVGGTWGSTTSTASHQNNTYFAATSGELTVPGQFITISGTGLSGLTYSTQKASGGSATAAYVAASSPNPAYASLLEYGNNSSGPAVATVNVPNGYLGASLGTLNTFIASGACFDVYSVSGDFGIQKSGGVNIGPYWVITLNVPGGTTVSFSSKAEAQLGSNPFDSECGSSTGNANGTYYYTGSGTYGSLGGGEINGNGVFEASWASLASTVPSGQTTAIGTWTISSVGIELGNWSDQNQMTAEIDFITLPGVATNVTIANPSFESPALSSTGSTASFTSWTTTSPVNSAGTFYPGSSTYTSSSGAGGYVGLVPNGNNVAYIYGSSTTGASINQTLTGITLLPNTVYTLTGFAGARGDSLIWSSPTTATVELLAGGVVIATGAVNAPIKGYFAPWSITYTTPSTGVPTGNLGISLGQPGTQTGQQVNYDDVTLSYASATASSSATTLASSQNPSLLGGAVTFTATVTGSGATPTGTVTFSYAQETLFYNNVGTIGTATVNSAGVANFSTTALPVAIASDPLIITAVYSGDSSHDGSSVSSVSQVVTGPSSVTILNPGFESPTLNPQQQQNPGPPTSWTQNANYEYALNPLNDGFYPEPNNTLPPPAGGANICQVDDGGALSQTLTGFTEAADTTYVLTGVVGREAFSGLPFGQPTAELIAGSTTLINDTTIPAPIGPTPGNENGTGLFGVWSASYTSGTSVTSGQTLQVELGMTGGDDIVDFDNIALNYGIPTTTALAVSSSSGLSNFVATVSGAGGTTPNNGTVTFYDGNGTITLGTATVSSGTATLNSVAISSGSHSFTAAYGGSTSGTAYGGSISTVTLVAGPLDHFAISTISSPQQVGIPFSITTITAQDVNNNTVTSFTGTVTFGGTAGVTGTSGSFTAGVLSGASVIATVAGSSETVTVSDGAGHTGSATIASVTSGGTAPLTAVGVGSQSTTPTYGTTGSPLYTVTLTQTGTASDTATLALIGTLPTGATASFSPQPASFSSISSTTSTLTIKTAVNTPAGTYTFTVGAYGANSVTSSSFTLVVNKATPTLLVNNSPVTFNGTAQAATIAPSTPGTVSSILTGGAATQTSPGTYAVTANFTPTDTTDYNSLTAASAGNFIINMATPTITVASSQNPSLSGGAVTFTTGFTGSPSPSPTGTVTFYYNGTNIGTGTLSSGVANFSTATLPIATPSLPLSITGVYSGDANYNTTTSSVLSQVVTAPTTISIVNSNFEAPSIAQNFDGLSQSGTPSGWTGAANTANVGEFNPDIPTAYTSIPAVDGYQLAFITGIDDFYQTLTGVDLLANQTYVMTVVVSWRNDETQFGTPYAQLIAGSTAQTPTIAGTNYPAQGKFVTWTYTYTAPATGGQVGQVLEVLLGGSTATWQPNFDNVTLGTGLATTTALATSGTPSETGSSVTFTATVSAPAGSTAPNSGTVTFYDTTGSSWITLGTGTVSSGVATFNTSSLSVGTHSITAAYGGGGATYGGSISSTLSQVVANVGPAANLVITGSGTETAGVSQNLTITAEDANGFTVTAYTGSKNLTFSGPSSSGNPVTAPTVSSSSGTATAFGTATAITFSSGVATVSGANNGVMTLYDAQTATVSVTDGSVSSSGSGNLSVVVSAASMNQFALSLTSPQINGVAFTSVNTLTAEDAYGNTVTSFNASGNNVTIAANSPLTGAVSGLSGGNKLNNAGDFSLGVANLTTLGMTYTGNANTGTFTATAATGGYTGTSGNVTINGGGATKLVITGSGTETAGVSQNLTITAEDSSGNTATTYAGSRNLTFSGASSSGNPVTAPTVSSSSGTATAFGTGTAITFSSGVAMVSGPNNGVMTLYDAQTATVSVSDGSINSSVGGNLSVVVSAASMNKFAMSLASPQINGVAFTGVNTLTAEDAYGNTVTSFNASGNNVTIAANSPLTGAVSGLSGGNELNNAGDFSLGVANLTTLGMTYTGNANTGTFTATAATGGYTGTSGNVTINGGGATKLVITGSGTETAGVSQNLTITAEDSSGNTATSYAGSKNLTFSGASSSGNPVTAPTVSSSSGTATAFGTGTAITFSSGVAAVSGPNNGVMTLYDAQTATVSVSDGSINSSVGGNLSVVVSAASMNKFALSLASPQINGVAFTGVNTLTAEDAYGNTVTTFSASANNVTIGANSPLTGAVSGLSGGNKLNNAGDFSSGVANLTTLGMIYTGNANTGTFTATAATGGYTGTSGNVTINVGTATKLVITGSGTETAGVSQNLTITALDAGGNTATGYTGSQNLTFSGASSSGNPVTAPTVVDNTGAAINFGSTTAITFTTGVATVSGGNNGVMTLYDAQTATVSVSDGSINSSAGGNLSVVVSAASMNKFAMSLTSPQINGVAFTGINTLTAEDAYGNTVTSFNASANNVTIAANPPLTGAVSGFLGGNTLNNAGDFNLGVANLTSLEMTYTGNANTGTFTATAATGGYTGTSGNVTINAGGATKLVITGSGTETAGVSQNLTITAEDSSGNTIPAYTGSKPLTFSGASSSGNPVTAPTVVDNTGATINFGSTTAITFSSGVATVSGGNNGVMTLYDAQTATISVTDGSISSSGSGNLSVVVSAASMNNFVLGLTSPQNNGVAFTGVNTLTAEDAYGNTVTTFSASGNNVTIAANSPLTGAVSGLSGGNTLTSGGDFNSGVANLTTLGMTYTGNANTGTFTATAATGGYTGTSGNVTINVGGATQLVITGSGTQTAGTSQNLTITAEDVSGNTITSYAGSKTLTFSGASSSGNPVTKPTVVNSSGTVINFGSATAITFSSGVATVSGGDNGVMTLYDAQTATISVTDGSIGSSGSGNLTVIVSAASANQLAFTTQPSASTVEGVAFAQQPVVTIEDQYGNTVTSGSDSTANVALTLTSGPGTLGGTTSIPAVAGVADFSSDGLNINLAGTNDVLTATASIMAGTKTAMTHPAFTITPVSAPTANAATYYHAKGTDIQISVTNLLAKFTQSDSFDDPVELLSVAGGLLTNDMEIATTTNDSVVFFANPYQGSDYIILGPLNDNDLTYTNGETFSYVVCDTNFTSAPFTATSTITIKVYAAVGQFTGNLTITGDSITLTFAGIPLTTNIVQRATVLPGPWTDLNPLLVFPAGGVTTYTDTPSPPLTSAFYRLKQF